MRLAGKLGDNGVFGIYVLSDEVGAATSTTASGTAAVFSSPMSQPPFVVTHPHTEVELAYAIHLPARSVQFAEIPEGKPTLLDGVMIGGAVLCIGAGGVLRRRYHDVATRPDPSPT